MEYLLHKLDINYDKKLKVKDKNNVRIEIDAIASKTFKRKREEMSKLAQKTKDYSLEYHVIGSTFFQKYDENSDKDADYIEIEGKKYLISDSKMAFTRGYLYVGNNEFIKVSTRIPFIILFLLLGLMILGLLFGLRSCTDPTVVNPFTPAETTIRLPIDGTDVGETTPNQTSHNEVSEEYIEISVFPQIIVDETTPNIPLYNAETNTVYFLFNIYEGDNLLHQTGLIPPGYRVQWNAKELLNLGTHDLTFVIECYDVETMEPCDGATTHCEVIVE